MTTKDNKIRVTISLGIFWGFFILYASTAPLTNVSYGDAGMFLTVSKSLGLAHPPGYSLYVLLLNVFANSPLPGTFAFKGHLVSSLLSAGALAILFQALWLITNHLAAKSKLTIISRQHDAFITSLIAVVGLGITYWYWIFGSITGEIALNNLFLATIIWALARLLSQQGSPLANMVIIAIGYGLGVSHYQPLIYTVPATIAGIWASKATTPNMIGKSLLAAVISFLIPLGLTATIAASSPPISWPVDISPQGLSQFISRIELYSTANIADRQYENYFARPDTEQVIPTIAHYSRHVLANFHWQIIMIVIGLLTLLRYHRAWFNVVIIGVASSGFLFASMLQWPESIELQGTLQKHYPMSYSYYLIPAAVGWHIILARGIAAIKIITNRSSLLVNLTVLTLVGLSIYFSAKQTYAQVNFRPYESLSNLYTQVLNYAEPDSLVGCFTDQACFSLLYEQQVNRSRRDILIIPTAFQFVQHRLESLPNAHGFNYATNPNYVLDYITWTADRRPTYLVDLTEPYYQRFGIDRGFYYYIPYGYFGKLTKQMPQQLPFPDRIFGQQGLQITAPVIDKTRQWQKISLARQHIFNSAMYIKADQRMLGRDELNLAANLLYQLPPPHSVENIRNAIESSPATSRFRPGSRSPEPDMIIDIISEQVDLGRIRHSYGLAVNLVASNPRHIEARLLLAELLEKLIETEAAKQEYTNVLTLDPDNQIAQERLKMLP